MLSYSGIVGYGKYTLPSVESWNTNNNIIKDPPRSVVAPRRDKVGSNSVILEEIEQSHDRIAESIRAYPRGVNPMVGVSYNGQGNAGIGSGQALLTRGQQAKLSYRVMMDGAFRPPVLAPVDLLPLSRMPRLVTHVDCAVNKPDFQKKLACEAQKNTYKHTVLNTSCQAVSTQNIQHPSEVQDRRQLNTRKHPIAKNVFANLSHAPSHTHTILPSIHLKARTLAPQALNLTKIQRRDIAGAGEHINYVQKHINPSLIGSIEGSRAAPKSAGAAPSALSGCRDSVLHAEILPRDVISHVVDLTRPAYKRAFKMGGILSPESYTNR